MNLFGALRITFRIIFEAFNEQNADEFYLEYKNMTLLDAVNDDEVLFFKKSE